MHHRFLQVKSFLEIFSSHWAGGLKCYTFPERQKLKRLVLLFSVPELIPSPTVEKFGPRLGGRPWRDRAGVGKAGELGRWQGMQAFEACEPSGQRACRASGGWSLPHPFDFTIETSRCSPPWV